MLFCCEAIIPQPGKLRIRKIAPFRKRRPKDKLTQVAYLKAVVGSGVLRTERGSSESSTE